MKDYTLQTRLFGELTIPAGEGLMEDYTITLGGRERTLTLYLEEELLSDATAPLALAQLEQIPAMYEQARVHLREQLAESELIQYFLRFHLDEVEDLAELLGLDAGVELTPALLLEQLEPRMIAVGQGGDGVVDCTFDFSIPEEYSDELLVVRFGADHQVDYVTHES